MGFTLLFLQISVGVYRDPSVLVEPTLDDNVLYVLTKESQNFRVFNKTGRSGILQIRDKSIRPYGPVGHRCSKMQFGDTGGREELRYERFIVSKKLTSGRSYFYRTPNFEP